MTPISNALAIGAFMIASSVAIASGTHSGNTHEAHAINGGAFTYEVFEYTVEHADLDTCPGEHAANEDVFCRLTLASDAAHVFVFSYDGDQALQAVLSFDLSADVLTF